jgi:hypothetical protein
MFCKKFYYRRSGNTGAYKRERSQPKSKVKCNANVVGSYHNYQNGAVSNQLTALEGGGECAVAEFIDPDWGNKVKYEFDNSKGGRTANLLICERGVATE